MTAPQGSTHPLFKLFLLILITLMKKTKTAFLVFIFYWNFFQSLSCGEVCHPYLLRFPVQQLEVLSRGAIMVQEKPNNSNSSFSENQKLRFRKGCSALWFLCTCITEGRCCLYNISLQH